MGWQQIIFDEVVEVFAIFAAVFAEDVNRGDVVGVAVVAISEIVTDIFGGESFG